MNQLVIEDGFIAVAKKKKRQGWRERLMWFTVWNVSFLNL